MERVDLLNLLKDKKITLSAMESLTGGAFSSSFVSLPGASEVFKGSIVSYSNEAKIHFGVDKNVIEKYGAVSKECALEMAKSCLSNFSTDVAVAFTGNAGPSVLEDKEVGLVYIAIVAFNQCYVYKLKFAGERSQIINSCVLFAYEKLIEIISK